MLEELSKPRIYVSESGHFLAGQQRYLETEKQCEPQLATAQVPRNPQVPRAKAGAGGTP